MVLCVIVQAEIIQDPAAFVELDPEMAYTLLDLKRAVSRAPPCLSSQISQHSGSKRLGCSQNARPMQAYHYLRHLVSEESCQRCTYRVSLLLCRASCCC